MPTYAIDTETYYSDDCSVAALGPYAYCRHPDWCCYLVSISGDDGYKFTGRPEDADWGRVNGQTWVMHNAPFDTEVIARMIEIGQIKPVAAKEIFDTADLARYLQQPGSLKEAAKELLGVEISKAVRTAMKNKVLADLPADKRQPVIDYAQADADLTLRLWLEHGGKWPEHERELSRLTREMGKRGMPIDLASLEAAITDLSTQLWNTRSLIPWDEPILSPKKVAVYCRDRGILPPLSMAKDSPVFDQWLEKHGDSHPAVAALSAYRRQNTLLERLKAMRSRLKEDGNCVYEMKYSGATNTRRWSGGGGLNFQNFPRDPMFGIDIRKLFTAPEGKLFAVVDLSSIEPRVLATLCKDKDLLGMLADPKNDIYEITARRVFGYNDPRPLKEVDKKLRQLSKAVTLGASYGTGPEKFVTVAKTMGGLDITEDESQRVIAEFRAANPLLVGLWKKLDRALKNSAGSSLVLNLASGNTLTYDGVRWDDKGNVVYRSVGMGGKKVDTKTYGSRLVENATQATAREVFAHYLLELDKEGFDVRLHVHDEVVILVNEMTAESDLKRIEQIMSSAPPWMPNLPALAEGHTCKQYAKS